MHGVLKHWHPMVGVDYHIPWPPNSPSPLAAPARYTVAATLLGWGLQAKTISDHMTDSWGLTLEKGTDIGTMIPHFGPPSTTLPIDMIFSASKSHFGSSRYVADNKPVAVALAAFVNPNLNCGMPAPTPTGEVIAFTTHWVEMSWADVLGGFGAMFSDLAIQCVLNTLGNALGNRLTKFLQPRLFPRLNFKWMAKVTLATEDAALRKWDPVLFDYYCAINAAARADVVANWAGTGLATVAGFLAGGPMGVDIGKFGGYTKNKFTPGGWAGDLVGGFVEGQYRAVGDYLDGPGPANY